MENNHSQFDAHSDVTDNSEGKSKDELQCSSYSLLSLAPESCTLKWETFDTDITFTVTPIDVPKSVAVNYLFRSNEEAYITACREKVFRLHLYPADPSVVRHFPHLIPVHEELGLAFEPSQGISFRYEFFHLSRLVKGVRVRKIVLRDQLNKLNTKIDKVATFLDMCERKMDAHLKRLSMLENELLLFEPYDSFQCSNLFGSFLSHSSGWGSVTNALLKEYKYLQQIAEEKENNAEEESDELSIGTRLERLLVRQGLGIDSEEIDKAWTLLRYWQVIFSAALRAHLESDGAYRVHGTPSKNQRQTPLSPQKNKGAADGVKAQKEMRRTIISSLSKGGIKSPKQGENASSGYKTEGHIDSVKLQEDGTSGRETGKGKKRGRDKSRVAIELTAKMQPPLPCGPAGVASWDAVCGFLSVRPPSSYMEERVIIRQESSGNSNLAAKRNQQVTEEEESVVDVAKEISKLVTDEGGYAAQRHTKASLMVVPHVSRISISNLQYTLNEESDSHRAIGKCLLAVADDIAQALEELLVEPFRRLNVWSSCLEGMRRERVKREGGQMAMRDNAEVEIDEQGQIRVIPNADEIVDTDILHSSMQRTRIHVAIPKAKARLKLLNDSKFDTEGELACVTQLGFATCVPYLQRAFRGCIVRHRVENHLRASLVLYSMHAAATVIQSCHRAKLGRARFNMFATERRRQCATTIQRIIRGYLARRVGDMLAEIKLQRLLCNGAIQMQRIVRGFLARRKVADILASAAEEKDRDNRAWAIVMMQKVARGYIARNSIVRSRHIRNNLSPEVLKLAERYMCDTGGDLWGFLKEVDETLKRYSKNIEESQQREDEWAETFVQRVIVARQDNFDSAWSSFASVQASKVPTLGMEPVSSGTAASSATRRDKSRSGTVGEENFQDSMLSIVVEDAGGSFYGESVNGINTPFPPPGPLLRRAVSSTVRRNTSQPPLSQTHFSMKKEKSLSPAKVERLQNIKAVYGQSSSKNSSVRASRRKVPTQNKSLNAPPGPGSLKKKSSIFTSQSKFKVEETKHSNLSQAYLNEEWMGSTELTNSVLRTKPNGSAGSPQKCAFLGSESNGGPQMIHRHGKPDPGESLLIDVPLGIEDKMDRLINAAAMRCYVPEIFSQSRSLDGRAPITAQEAYAMYQTLPSNSLAKMRYEQKVEAWCMPTVNRLRLKGLNFIKDALPVSKLSMFLRGVEAPPILIRTVVELARKLEQLNAVPSGYMRKEMKEEYQDIVDGKGKITRAIHAAVESRKPSKDADNKDGTKCNEEEDVDAEAAKLVAAEERSRLNALAQRLLERMITKGEWARMDAPMDALLQNAAFLICPFQRLDGSGAKSYDICFENKMSLFGLFGKEDETSEELRMGQLEFTAFANALVQLPSEDAMKSLIRDRFRAAVILSTPYELRLKKLGVMTVKDLATLSGESTGRSSDVAAILKSMPKPFLHQVEALLSMAISVTSEAKVLPASKGGAAMAKSTAITKDPIDKTGRTLIGPLSENPRLIQVPLAFDSKFQRGPLDPYGRPSRLIGQLPALRVPSQDSQRSRSLYANKGSVMPEVGPASTTSLSIQQAANRQRLISTELAAMGKYVSLDQQDMYSHIPHNLWEVGDHIHSTDENDIATGGDPSVEMWSFEPSLSHKLARKDSSGQINEDRSDSLCDGQSTVDYKSRRDNPVNTSGHVPQDRDESDVGEQLEAIRDQLNSHSSTRGAVPSRSNMGTRQTSQKQSRSSNRRQRSSVSQPYDTETRFERPHKCSFEGCNQAFSRVYTLKLHEKSHLMFPEYHKYRRDPMLSFDADAEKMVQESRQRLCTRESMPLLRDIELERTLLRSSYSSNCSLNSGD